MVSLMDLLRHLRFFSTVADTRHFGDAARDLGMTQPPLSQGIRRLERHLGVRLFDRNARGVRITATGQQLLPAARDLLRMSDDLVDHARDLSVPEVLRLGVAGDLEQRIPHLVRSVADSGSEVMPTVAGSIDLIDLLREGLLDIGVVRHPGVLDGLVPGPVTLAPTRMVLRGHAPPTSIRLAEVTLPIAVPPRHHQPPAHDQFVDALRRAGHSGAVREAGDAAQRQALVYAGLAVGITPSPDATESSPECPPLRLRIVLPHPGQRRPEIDYEQASVTVIGALEP